MVALGLTDLLGGRVTLSLQRFGLLQQFTPFFIQGQYFVNVFWINVARCQLLLKEFRVFTNLLDIEHLKFLLGI